MSNFLTGILLPLAFLFPVFSGSLLFGQNVTLESIQTSDGKVQYAVHVTGADGPLHNVTEIVFELSGLGGSGVSADFSPEAWFGGDGEVEWNFEWMEESGAWQVRLSRPDQDPRSGAGRIGILSVIDNVDVRRQLPKVANVRIGSGKQLKVSPQPASEWLHIESSQPILVDLRNYKGQVLLSGLKIDGTMRMDVSGLSNGVYFLTPRSEDGPPAQKVLVHRR